MSDKEVKEVIDDLLKTPKEMIKDIIKENTRLRQELHDINKKITGIAKNDVFACVEELIKERSNEIIPDYIEAIFSGSCTGGCCAPPSEKWDPSIGCYEYRDLRISKTVDMYFGDYHDDIDQEIVGHLKKLCDCLTEEVGIPFYVYEQDEEMIARHKKWKEEEEYE